MQNLKCLLVIEKFNLPDNRIPDTSNCTEASPCYYCKISIEYEDACLYDQAEKDANAKKRKFKVKSFLFDRLTNKHNDVHTKQAFHNKEPIKHCSRIEYQGDDLRKYFLFIKINSPLVQDEFKLKRVFSLFVL